MIKIDRNELLERFLRYVAVDTQSDYSSDSYPSSERQMNLMRMLRDELTAIGMSSVEIDLYGYLTATLRATEGWEGAPVVAFIAHVDTSPDMKGSQVKPQLVQDYAGGDIPLNEEYTISALEFPELKSVVGHTLITTDGTTLLGADDKAGVAEIVTAMKYLIDNPNVAHGDVRVAFTPDEEIGRGVDHFDVAKFGADYAYTMDGGAAGELEYENFNAAEAVITINGCNIHPGYAKGKMINALGVAIELDTMLPAMERPEFTEGREGFFHLSNIKGAVDRATVSYIVRDHDRVKFEARKALLIECAEVLNLRYGASVVDVLINDQYYNMIEVLKSYPTVVDLARQAIVMSGLEPIELPIRGGTDGARLSFMGLPCPNLFTGGMNFHSRYECCSLGTMEHAVATIVHLAELWGRKVSL